MARTETKNIVFASSDDVPVGGLVSVQMNVPDDIQKNFHNIWMSLSAHPINADANAEGTWVLYLEPDSTEPIFSPSLVNINLENINFKIIACGIFHASNQTPFNMNETLGKTSRNVRQNGRLILVSRIGASSSGLIKVEVMLCAGSVTI